MESNNLIKRMIKQEEEYILFDTEGKVENNNYQKFLDRMNKEPKVEPTLSRTSIYLSQPKKNESNYTDEDKSDEVEDQWKLLTIADLAKIHQRTRKLKRKVHKKLL